MNKNHKSIVYSNNKITKTTVDKNFNFNYLYKLLDLKDPNSFCEIEFINYSKKEIMNITSIISNNIKIKINNITSNCTVTKDKEDSIDLEEFYEDESIESDDDHNNESISTFVDIDDKINKLFIYDYENDYEEYIVLCLQPKSNKIVICVININNILDNKDYYAYYGSSDDEFGCAMIYGYIGRYIEFYAENYSELDPMIFIFRSNTKKQIANNIKKLDFIFQSADFGFIEESKDLDMFVNSFWHLYFLLGPEYFSYDYFILDELIPNVNKDYYLFFQNISFIITSDQEILDYLDIDYTYDYNFNIKVWRDNINPDMPNKNYLLNRLDFIQSKRNEKS